MYVIVGSIYLMSNADALQQPVQLWSIRLITAMHFVRCIYFLSTLVTAMLYPIEPPLRSINPVIIPIQFIPLSFIELVFGILILMRKSPVAGIAGNYVFAIFLGSIFPALSSLDLGVVIMALSSGIELLLLIFLGLLWISHERVRKSRD